MSTVRFESSQYVSIEFQLASLGLRLLAAFIDQAIFLMYFVIIVAFYGEKFILGYWNDTDLLIIFLLKLPLIFYNPFCEYFLNGQSIGKRIIGIRVVTNYGGPPKLKEVFIRWVIKGDFLWITSNALVLIWFAIGVIAIPIIALTNKNQRLADILANTLIIKTKSTQYQLSDVMKIIDVSNHEIAYPQVICFDDEDMLLIKNTIQRLNQHPNQETINFGRQLCDETTRRMGIEPISTGRLEFLQKVLQDYVVLTR